MKSVLAAVALILAAPAAFAASAKKGTALKLPAAALIEPKDLAARLSDAKAKKPVVIQVGFIETYKIGHIPGTDYAGPASRAEGLQRLRDYVKDLPRGAEIVLYCGCCPWKFCPNVQPAYAALKKLGFKRVKVLHIATGFGQEWSGAGYPAVPGS